MEFQTARIFEADSKAFSKPKIKILAVNSEGYVVPPWDEFKRVIRSALPLGVSERLIDSMEKAADSSHGFGLSNEASRKLDLFRSVVKGELEIYNLRMHCEAVFVALLDVRGRHGRHSNSSAIDRDSEFKTLVEISKVLGVVFRCKIFRLIFFQNLQEDMISVSKLCCPVCWELFEALNLDTKIRGCHPTVTPVALPETLSLEISEKMVTRLRTLLDAQVNFFFLEGNDARRTQHSRNESETGHSTTSSNECASECGDSYQSYKATHQKGTAKTPIHGA